MIEIIVGWDRFLGLSSFQNCSSGIDCGTVVWDLSRMILVVCCICCSLRLEIEIQFFCVIACLNNMWIVRENDVNIYACLLYINVMLGVKHVL